MKNTTYKTLKDEQKTANWLKANGISQQQFERDDLWLLQAQKSATALLKNQIDLLNNQQQTKLMAFCCLLMDSNKRKKITKHMTYEVLNIGKQVKRKQFVANKTLAKARRTIQEKRQATTRA